MEEAKRQKRFQNALMIYKDKLPFSLLYRLLDFTNEIDLQNWLLDLDTTNFSINLEDKSVEYVDTLEQEIEDLFRSFTELEQKTDKKLKGINKYYESDLIYGIISFLRGGSEIQVQRIADTQGYVLAQVLTYVLDQGEGYHRQNYCKLLLSVFNSKDLLIRDLGWALMQKTHLSHLLEIPDLITRSQNSRRLRLALAVRFARSSKWEVYRAFLLSPKKFKRLIIYCKLPRDKIGGVPITNPSYTLCIKLIKYGFLETAKREDLDFKELLLTTKVPLHRLMHYISKDFEEIAVSLSSEEFLRHARFFKKKLGSDRFDKITTEKINTLKNPFEFLRKEEHLEDTGSLPPFALELIRQRSNEMVEKLLYKYEIRRIAILVDVSTSLEITKTAGIHLFHAFYRMAAEITHLIAFNHKAWPVSVEELQHTLPRGRTSIGGAFSYLFSQLEKQPQDAHPQVILLITDYKENTKPYLKDVLADPPFRIPFVTIRLIGERNLLLPAYPYTVLPIKEYHGSFLVNYLKELVFIISQLINEPKQGKLEPKPKFILEEAITKITPVQRNEQSKTPGYLKSLLAK